MVNFNIKKLSKCRAALYLIIVSVSICLLYMLISIYFTNHFFFNTIINGVDVSLKTPATAEEAIKKHIKDYRLQLIERNGIVEGIKGQDIDLRYNDKNSLSNIHSTKHSYEWIMSLLKKQDYYIDDLYTYNEDALFNKLKELNCLNKAIIEPQNVSFMYSNGSYQAIKEVYGNKVIVTNLSQTVRMSVLKGTVKLDLNEKQCYENPMYTLNSVKTPKTRDLLNQCVKTKITYKFGSETEVLDGVLINKWLSVNENLDVVLDEISAAKYIQTLSRKYDTVGIARNFRTSLGKIVEVKGGLYGWKIDRDGELKALIESIKQGKTVEKEPKYAQKSLPRGEDEIGDTYVEINITRQYLWFYKNGKLVAQGAVVTGNPNRGYSTVLGTYMLNYKQKDACLEGPDYATVVKYWMPFFGNTGIHDATWRYSFGGNIYKQNGSHGCVNTPMHLAKTLYENIEDGTPIICYEE